MLRIAQISDIHIGFDRDHPHEPNLRRLEQIVARLGQTGLDPALVLLTGDLTEHGDPASYARLIAALAPLDLPVWPIPGNHDDRAVMAQAFGLVLAADGFAHYAIDLPGLRVIMLDTLEPGRHGGGFCEARAQWLGEQLAAAPATPTLIAMHHPPFASGIAWMDPADHEPWIARFGAAIAGHRQIVAITCGHVHRTCTTQWQGVPVMICPSSAPAVTLHPAPIDPDHADGRAMISDEGAGAMLHCWDGIRLISHSFAADPGTTLARHDGRMTALLQHLAAERDLRGG